MLSMRLWRHERSVNRTAMAKTVVRDRLTFELRAPHAAADTGRRGRDWRAVRAPAPSPCSGISPAEFIDDAGDVQGDGQAGLVERTLQDASDLVESVDERVAVHMQALRRPGDVERALAPSDQRRAQRHPVAVGKQRREETLDEAGPRVDRHDRQGLMQSNVFDLVDLRLRMHDRPQLQGVEGISRGDVQFGDTRSGGTDRRLARPGHCPRADATSARQRSVTAPLGRRDRNHHPCQRRNEVVGRIEYLFDPTHDAF